MLQRLGRLLKWLLERLQKCPSEASGDRLESLEATAAAEEEKNKALAAHLEHMKQKRAVESRIEDAITERERLQEHLAEYGVRKRLRFRPKIIIPLAFAFLMLWLMFKSCS